MSYSCEITELKCNKDQQFDALIHLSLHGDYKILLIFVLNLSDSKKVKNMKIFLKELEVRN